MNTEMHESHGAVAGQVDCDVRPDAASSDGFDAPHAVDAVTAAFPANVAHLMPRYADIPAQCRAQSNPWVKWQQEWFFSGLKQLPTAKPGIDLNAAMRHLKAIQGSFHPKHEHKEAAVAFLASRWFERA